MKISIVIPAHNEENNLPKIVPALLKELNKYVYELIIVNDASDDNTKQVAEKLAKKYKKMIAQTIFFYWMNLA